MFMTMATALVAGFSSCNNDDDNSGIGVSGKDTGLKISIPSPKTYADENATDAEQTFNSAHVFVYNGGTLETDKSFSIDDFKLESGNFVMKEPMIVKSGQKNIFVGLNLTDDDVAAVKAGLHASYATTVAAITTTNGFAMFNINHVNNFSFLLKENDENPITVKVERWVAKVSARVSDKINDEASGAKISDFSFAMGNVNMKMFPMQKLGAGTLVEDPNWSLSDTEVENAIGKEFINEFGTNDSTIISAFTPVNAPNTEIKDRKNKYVLENTTSNPRKGDATYTCVRANFVPKVYHKYENDILTVATSPGSVPDSLFVVETVTGETYYFTVKAEANAFKTAKNAKIETYKKGLCYYYLYLGGDDSYSTLRNNFYDQLITKVNSLGYPDPYPVDPTTPLSKETQLTVEVEIQPWTVVPSSNEMGKI